MKVESSVNRFVAIDPGTTTGIVWAQNLGSYRTRSVDGAVRGSHEILVAARNEHDLWSGEVDCREWWTAGAEIAEQISFFEPEVIVMEDFQIRGFAGGRAAGQRNLLDPVRVMGAIFGGLAVLGSIDSVSVRFQQPSQISIIDSDRLRSLGLWVVGSDHCRDAMKHAIIFMRS